jgi:Flp pilus assembly protein protease CpaA
MRMLRYLLVFSFLLLLGVAASAAASAADAPAVGQIAFLVCLGLFAAALAGGVADRRLHRPKARPASGAR